MKFTRRYSKDREYTFEEVYRSQLCEQYSSGQIEKLETEVILLREAVVFLASKLNDNDKLELLNKNYSEYELVEE